MIGGESTTEVAQATIRRRRTARDQVIRQQGQFLGRQIVHRDHTIAATFCLLGGDELGGHAAQRNVIQMRKEGAVDRHVGVRRLEVLDDAATKLVGGTRAAVNRALADLEKLGAIKVGRGRVELLDTSKLRAQIRY